MLSKDAEKKWGELTLKCRYFGER